MGKSHVLKPIRKEFNTFGEILKYLWITEKEFKNGYTLSHEKNIWKKSLMNLIGNLLGQEES